MTIFVTHKLSGYIGLVTLARADDERDVALGGGKPTVVPSHPVIAVSVEDHVIVFGEKDPIRSTCQKLLVIGLWSPPTLGF